MIYRAKIAVLRAVPGKRDFLSAAEISWHDIVVYTCGINAGDASEAVRLAVSAAHHAVDRKGEYVGGVVIEVECRCVGLEEFHDYEKYFHAPIENRGIFYVSGITYSSLPLGGAPGATAELERMKAQIGRFGVPTPSFVHPQLKVEPLPEKVCVVCPVCGHWIEMDNLGLLYSFFDGLHDMPAEYDRARKAGRVSSRFFGTHFQCLTGQDEHLSLIFVYQDNPAYALLDQSKREDLTEE